MNAPNPYSQYRQTSAETATPLRLVVMLYDGAIRFLSQAVPAMHARQYEAQTRNIGKAQDILAHLRATLNYDAGSVARTLDTFYITAYDALTDANVHDRVDKTERVIEGLREMRDAWVEVERRCQAGKSETGGMDTAAHRAA